MKIVLAGGGTGGHFYPLIAVAQEIRRLTEAEHLVAIKLYFMSNDPYSPKALFANNITYLHTAAGKRSGSQIGKVINLGKTIFGFSEALIKLFLLYPDVVFGKGAYASFPAVAAARLLGIPVVIHESDSIPGRVNLWAGKFAQKIALSYPEAVKYFPREKTAVTGNPIRRDILTPIATGAQEFLSLEEHTPVLLVLGGSQGAMRINDVILTILPKLVEKYQIIHQAGRQNLADCQKQSATILTNHPQVGRYHLFDYLDDTALRMAAGAATLIISRAGSTIFEIANWGLPSIIIPIPESISHDQKTNAFTYARGGGAVVIEEENLTPSVLLSEINRLLADDNLLATMKSAAKTYANPEAGSTIARVLVDICLAHEQ